MLGQRVEADEIWTQHQWFSLCSWRTVRPPNASDRHRQRQQYRSFNADEPPGEHGSFGVLAGNDIDQPSMADHIGEIEAPPSSRIYPAWTSFIVPLEYF
jgi:hypothetical protein